MLDRTIQQGGLRSGEFFAISGTTYYGGSPLAVNTQGLLLLAVSGISLNFVGVAANDSATDGVSSTVNSPTTFYGGETLATLKASGVNYPYDNTLTWTAGDKLYINQVGKWSNVKYGTQTAKGVVLGVDATSITVLFGGNYE